MNVTCGVKWHTAFTRMLKMVVLPEMADLFAGESLEV